MKMTMKMKMKMKLYFIVTLIYLLKERFHIQFYFRKFWKIIWVIAKKLFKPIRGAFDFPIPKLKIQLRHQMTRIANMSSICKWGTKPTSSLKMLKSTGSTLTLNSWAKSLGIGTIKHQQYAGSGTYLNDSYMAFNVLRIASKNTENVRNQLSDSTSNEDYSLWFSWLWASLLSSMGRVMLWSKESLLLTYFCSSLIFVG